MKIKSYIIFVIAVLSFQCVAHAQDSEEMYTIYLVRHAEKDITDKLSVNPSLTECGQKRAQSLAVFLKDVDLDAIYSTDYLRTKNTAQPTAKKKELDIEIYMPRELKGFAKLLLESKKDALVVGHSNTTGVLAGLLIGEEIKPFDEKIYNRIYQVVICGKTARLHVLHTTFECEH